MTGDRVGRDAALAPFDQGFMLGILVGEGHFGGDGRQPQVTLRMHTRHLELFLWLLAAVPGSKLYGPYHHGGRDYYQWMARGWALRDHLWPLIAGNLAFLDGHVRERVTSMATRYGLPVGEPGADAAPTDTDVGRAGRRSG